MVHKDSLKLKSTNSSDEIFEKFVKRLYVPQCFVSWPFVEGHFSLPHIDLECQIHTGSFNRKFKVSGHFFSEQNNITNACTQAAIKVALKCRYPEITAEEINSKIGVNHVDHLGTENLKPLSYKEAIEEISDTELTAFILKNKDMPSSLEFWQTVHLAVDSRLPVILLFDLAWEKENREYGHAVTIIGYTVNQHSWWSYGLIPQVGLHIEELKYLSSVLWCSNFILQDDRVGPYYFLPKNFLSYSKETTPSRFRFLHDKFESLKRYACFNQNNIDEILYDPLYAVIVTRSPSNIWKNILFVEQFAYLWIKRFLNLLEEDGVLENDSYDDEINPFESYFYKYYEKDQLILRTVYVSKSDYFDSIREHEALIPFKRDLERLLPEFFMLIEISVPELFWINHKKIGEIVIGLDIIEKPLLERDSCVLFARLPLLAFFNRPEIDIKPISQKRFHYDMVNPRGICV